MTIFQKYSGIVLLFVVFIYSGTLKAQIPGVHGELVLAIPYNGDTIPYINLPVYNHYAKRSFKNQREEQRYRRLVRDVKRAYPYARVAGEKLRAYNDTLLLMGNEVKKKKYMKKVEDALKEEFGNELRQLTITQGKILVRLIDRETGDTSYELVKELRGAFSAFFWQTLAKVFGQDLKTQYDPNGQDKEIEDIIVLIENGQL